MYLTVCCESPSLNCTQFYLIYPTPGLSDTLGQTLDNPDPSVFHAEEFLANKVRP